MVYQKEWLLDEFNTRSVIKNTTFTFSSDTGGANNKRSKLVSKFEGDRCCEDVRFLITQLNGVPY